MSKFGQLIDDTNPLLLVFYNEADSVSSSMNPVLKDVASTMGDSAKVIKINVDKIAKTICI